MAALSVNVEDSRALEGCAAKISTQSTQHELSAALHAWKLRAAATAELKRKCNFNRRKHNRLCLKEAMTDWSWQTAAAKAEAREAEVS